MWSGLWRTALREWSKERAGRGDGARPPVAAWRRLASSVSRQQQRLVTPVTSPLTSPHSFSPVFRLRLR